MWKYCGAARVELILVRRGESIPGGMHTYAGRSWRKAGVMASNAGKKSKELVWGRSRRESDDGMGERIIGDIKSDVVCVKMDRAERDIENEVLL